MGKVMGKVIGKERSNTGDNSQDKVRDLIDITSELIKDFGCENDFFLKPLIDLEWTVKSTEDFSMLSYWDSNDKKIEAIIVRKKLEPLIFEYGDYTMVIAIDCVKIGFIFKSNKKLKKL